ncbi:gag-pol polyprotein [Tanacetum coccineum]
MLAPEGFMETYKTIPEDIRKQLDAEAEAVQIILTGIDNDIYSTVDAYPNACEMWKAFKRLKQELHPNTSRTKQLNTPRLNRGTGYDNQRAVNVAGARENVARECQKPKRAKDAAYHKEKILLSHYPYMAKIQEVILDAADNSGPIFDTEPLQKVKHDDNDYNVFANERIHNEQPESVNEHIWWNIVTNVIIDSLDVSLNGEEVDQDDDLVMRYFAFGRHLEEIYMTWAHLEKKWTRLRTNTNISQDYVLKGWRRHSIDLNGATRNTTRLRLFGFTLCGQAINWLDCLPAGSISTWNDLTTRFLAQIFQPERTAKLQNDILMFQQHQGVRKYGVSSRSLMRNEVLLEYKIGFTFPKRPYQEELEALETDIRQKDEKSSQKRQNRARNGKAWKRQVKSKPKTKKSTKVKVKTGAGIEEYLMGPPEPI